MTEVNRLIERIIPPADYQHRNGFSNDDIVDSLTAEEKELVESELINRLSDVQLDTLMVETLAYMRSKNALESLKAKLHKEEDNLVKIIIASSIFTIQPDQELIDVSVVAFKQIEALPQNYFYNRTALVKSFYYLVKFQAKDVDELVRAHLKHPDYLVADNAKRYLKYSD